MEMYMAKLINDKLDSLRMEINISLGVNNAIKKNMEKD